VGDVADVNGKSDHAEKNDQHKGDQYGDDATTI
jgi:hypothetical protein